MPELIEIVGQDRPVIQPGARLKTSRGTFVVPKDGKLAGGSTVLRFVNCNDVLVEAVLVSGMLGPGNSAGGNDGQGIQFDKSWGKIIDVIVIGNDAAEDLISIYADEPVHGLVEIDNPTLYGRGTSNSSTSMCLDGPCCPTTVIKGGKIVNPRCGITIAGGINHTITGVRVYSADTDCYVQDCYGTPGFGGFTITGNKFPHGVLLGDKPGSHNTIG